MHQNRYDGDNSHDMELHNLVAEVRSDLERALLASGMEGEARDIVSMIADKMDAVADLIRN